MQISVLIREFLSDCEVRELTDASIGNYKKQLRQFETFLRDNCNAIELENLCPLHIKQFINMLQHRECKPAYIYDMLKAVKCLCGYAFREGYTEKLLTEKIRNVKQPKVLIHTISSKKIEPMIKYYKLQKYQNYRVFEFQLYYWRKIVIKSLRMRTSGAN